MRRRYTRTFARVVIGYRHVWGDPDPVEVYGSSAIVAQHTRKKATAPTAMVTAA